MSGDLDTDKVHALFVSAQNQRTHWSGSITQLLNFTIISNAAVWTLFLTAYINYFEDKGYWQHSYIALASTISILLLFLWRLYTQHLDNSIVHLYPELVFFESKLSCPFKFGTFSYLQRCLSDGGKLLSSELTADNRAEIVSKLVEKKMIGGRGHGVINVLTLVIMLILAFLVFWLGIFELKIGYGASEGGFVRPELKIISGALSIIGIIGMSVLIGKSQKTPCKQQVKEIIDLVTMDTKK